VTLRFLDTNILVYSLSRTPEDQWKRARAHAVLQEGGNALSVQVLQEFYVQATRPSARHLISHEQTLVIIAEWKRFPVQPMTLEVLFEAFRIKALTGFSYWDSAILAAARALGCDTVLTEDLSHGQVVEGMRIVNPFLPAA